MRSESPAELLPGENLVREGLADLERGVESVESLLVSVGAPRLRRLGISIPKPFPQPEVRLYEVLSQQHGDAAHSRYNALIRRLVSFERACACIPFALQLPSVQTTVFTPDSLPKLWGLLATRPA